MKHFVVFQFQILLEGRMEDKGTRGRLSMVMIYDLLKRMYSGVKRKAEDRKVLVAEDLLIGEELMMIIVFQ